MRAEICAWGGDGEDGFCDVGGGHEGEVAFEGPFWDGGHAVYFLVAWVGASAFGLDGVQVSGVSRILTDEGHMLYSQMLLTRLRGEHHGRRAE